jgi:NSS family neurotransmitter:Na+ symporter
MVFLVGVPLLLGEFALGRSTQRESAAAFEALAPTPRSGRVGLLGVLVAGLILAYYAVIAGWVMKYLALYLLGHAQAFAAPGFAVAFDSFIVHPVEPLLWQLTVMALTIAVAASGVERGIEAVSKLLMPALGLLLDGTGHWRNGDLWQLPGVGASAARRWLFSYCPKCFPRCGAAHWSGPPSSRCWRSLP